MYSNIKVMDQKNKNICLFSNNTNVTEQGMLETLFHNCCVCIIPTANAAKVGNLKFCWYQRTLDTNALLFELFEKNVSFVVCEIISSLILMSWQNCFWWQRWVWSLIEFSCPSKTTTVLFADLPRYLTLVQHLSMISLHLSPFAQVHCCRSRPPSITTAISMFWLLSVKSILALRQFCKR